MSAGLRERLLKMADTPMWIEGNHLKEAWALLREAAAALAGEDSPDRYRDALRQLNEIQGDIIPVYNDEFIRASWVREIVSKALAAGDAAPRVAPSQWQPIETAPKDTDILLWNGWNCQIGKFSTTFGVWMTGPREPEAWMPLPSPPATTGSDGEAQIESTSTARATSLPLCVCGHAAGAHYTSGRCIVCGPFGPAISTCLGYERADADCGEAPK